MATIVITGGTDGMGRALALEFLQRGDTVAVVGRSQEKGQSLLDAAKDTAGRAIFLQADLSSMSANRRVIEALRAEFAVVDVLVLCARHFRSTRLITDEGFEHTFATFYLSRFMFSHGLVAQLERASRPVVMNVGGPGEGGEVHWDNLTLAQGYDGFTALGQAGIANDMLGIAFAEAYPEIAYVLFHPGIVAGSFAGEYDAEMEKMIADLTETGRPVAEAIVPILDAIDRPQSEPLTVLAQGAPIELFAGVDWAAAKRMEDITRPLLAPYLTPSVHAS